MNHVSENDSMHPFPPKSNNDEIPSVSHSSTSTATTATTTTVRSSLRAHFGSVLSQEHKNPATAALEEAQKVQDYEQDDCCCPIANSKGSDHSDTSNSTSTTSSSARRRRVSRDSAPCTPRRSMSYNKDKRLKESLQQEFGNQEEEEEEPKEETGAEEETEDHDEDSLGPLPSFPSSHLRRSYVATNAEGGEQLHSSGSTFESSFGSFAEASHEPSLPTSVIVTTAPVEDEGEGSLPGDEEHRQAFTTAALHCASPIKATPTPTTKTSKDGAANSGKSASATTPTAEEVAFSAAAAAAATAGSADGPPPQLPPLGGGEEEDEEDHVVAAAKADLVYVEIEPGLEVPFWGAEETIEAVSNDQVVPTYCHSCSCDLYAIEHCEYIICNACRAVSPMVNLSQDDHQLRLLDPEPKEGLGIGFTQADLEQMYQEIETGELQQYS